MSHRIRFASCRRHSMSLLDGVRLGFVFVVPFPPHPWAKMRSKLLTLIFASQIMSESLAALVPEQWKEFVPKNFSWDMIDDKVIRSNAHVFPPKNLVFNALELVAPEAIKCIIIGQDPYINEGQANGLAFSVSDGTKIPPSLANIFKELLHEYLKKKTDENVAEKLAVMKTHGDLTKWCEEGVFLINTVLTVEKGKSNSHKNIGWEEFTGTILRKLDQRYSFVVLCLGRQAEAVANRFIVNNHKIIVGHPSPLNSLHNFIGSNCFKRCNEILTDVLGKEPIKWTIIFKQWIR